MIKEKKRKKCTCDDFIKYNPQIDSIFTLAWSHGYVYLGKQQGYCGWCGKKLK